MTNFTSRKIVFFRKNYTPIFSHTVLNSSKKYLWKSKIRKCRFCDKTEAETTFKSISHSISNFLGNNELISFDECDKCNNFFSINYEKDLDNLTKVYRTIGFIKGKKKLPSYKTKNKDIRFEHNENGLNITSKVNSSARTFSFNKKEVAFTLDYGSFIPTNAYRALLKMALSITPPDELSFLSDIKRWLMEPSGFRFNLNPQCIITTLLPGNIIATKPHLILLKKTSNFKRLPTYIFQIRFGHVAMQIFMPTNKDLKERHSFYPLRLPTLDEKNIPFKMVSIEKENYASSEVVRDKKTQVSFIFDEVTIEKI